MQTPGALPQILLVEDDAALRAMLIRTLQGFDVRAAATLAEARRMLDPLPDAVLTDVHLGADSGLTLAAELHRDHPRLPVLVMTAFGDLSIAVDALRAGAWDFLTKPVDLELLESALSRATEMHRLRREVRELRRTARLTRPYQDLVGECGPMVRLSNLIERIASVSTSVVIQGESGTGKELVARALHTASTRKAHAFVPINCAAVPETLLEAELFGHVRGAFTDAHVDRTGLLVQAHQGTLFLDEIGDMPPSIQAKLLRVLEERKVRPLGAREPVDVDVRIVAATHRDLDALVEAGAFRQDLLFRLDVFRLDVPPLRERGTDVLLLAQRFVGEFAARFEQQVSGITPEAAARLMDYRWPGNVRELRNCIERAVILCEHEELQLADLPPKLQAVVHESVGDDARLFPLAEVERRHIRKAMDVLGGHRGRVAEVLGIDRKTLYRKLASYGEPQGPQ